METQQSSSTEKKVNYKILKSIIEKNLNKKYAIYQLKKSELDYDLDIDEEFKKNCMIDGDKTINYDLINNLPSLNSVINDIPDDDDDSEEEIEENEPVDDEIDKNCLEKECIGDKWYYFDYTKGIIYDLEYNIIGNIDDTGEINIES